MSSHPPLARNDLVLVTFPFTDLSGSKVRPGLVAGQPVGDDVIIAFVSSRVGAVDTRSDYLLEPTDPEFGATGLKAASVIRLGKLATLHRRLVPRRLGRLGPHGEQAVARCLRHVFGL